MINFSGYEKPRGSVIRSASKPESARIPSYLFISFQAADRNFSFSRTTFPVFL